METVEAVYMRYEARNELLYMN